MREGGGRFTGHSFSFVTLCAHLETRRHLGNERVDERGVAHAHVGKDVHDVGLHGGVSGGVQDLAEGGDYLLGVLFPLSQNKITLILDI